MIYDHASTNDLWWYNYKFRAFVASDWWKTNSLSGGRTLYKFQNITWGQNKLNKQEWIVWDLAVGRPRFGSSSPSQNVHSNLKHPTLQICSNSSMHTQHTQREENPKTSREFQEKTHHTHTKEHLIVLDKCQQTALRKARQMPQLLLPPGWWNLLGGDYWASRAGLWMIWGRNKGRPLPCPCPSSCWMGGAAGWKKNAPACLQAAFQQQQPDPA